MSESDEASMHSHDNFSDISIDLTHPDEKWTTITNSPRIHSFVAFSINPGVTLDSLYGEDVTEALSADSLPHKTYVGFVQQMYGLPCYDDPYTDCRIYFVTRGPPSHDANRYIEPDMSVPLWPVTEHSFDRESVKLRDPFPWPNCYLHSMSYIDVRVLSSEFADASINAVMLFPEASRLREFRTEDHVKQKIMAQDRGPSLLVESKSGSPHKVPARNSERVAKVSEDAEQELQSTYEEVGNILFDIMHSQGSDNVTVEATYDLSSISSLPEPQDFFEEEKVLRTLAQDFLERKAFFEAEEQAGWEREMREEQERLLAAKAPHSAGTPLEHVSSVSHQILTSKPGNARPSVFTRVREHFRRRSSEKSPESHSSLKQSRYNLGKLFTHTRARFSTEARSLKKQSTVLKKTSPSVSGSLAPLETEKIISKSKRHRPWARFSPFTI
ncbi:hypothetical protein JAAARDRAFT_33138 [Jaapia argillacea MUCL 33604]|uniref:Uncharacterized protein n=1 Tax=Jaapia argillacea MUCL 33604 TaxID=933084 RepID=A0A067PXY6_9AGAM|nr:hypothetical protein JAAARDRAFT_33138 [Jaapia argillacea MUCL 33604]